MAGGQRRTQPGSSARLHHGPDPVRPVAAATADQIEAEWLSATYRGDLPQLTGRALALGAVLGAMTGISNLYVGLKVGWSAGVVVTASVMGWGIWWALLRIRVARTPLSVLEANAMASTASAAGYSTGVNLVSAASAYALVVGQHMPFVQLTVWTLSVAALGLFLAIPLKRHLVDVEALPFPTGTAAAQTLTSLYENAVGTTSARRLGGALAVGLALKWLSSGLAAVGSTWALPAMVPTPAMQEAVPWLGTIAAFTWSLELTPFAPAIGALLSWRVGWSLLVGALACFGLVAPHLVATEQVAAANYREIVGITLWFGVPLMVSSSLASFAMRWRVVTRSFRALRTTKRSAGPGPNTASIPNSWFWRGGSLSALTCIVLSIVWFEIPWALAIASVTLAALLALVAARVTGETDQTPAGPLGKVAQLGYGAAAPGLIVPNLMAASVTVGAATSAADLLTDFKSGRLLGANPRLQFIAQGLGVLVGVAVVVPIFREVLIADPTQLGSELWPAPAAMLWISVAKLFGEGQALTPTVVTAIWAGSAAGLAVSVIERWLGDARVAWVPSPVGVGLAFILPAWTSLGLCLGAGMARHLRRRNPDTMGSWLFPVVAGLIAGESLMGVAVALITH